MRKNHYYSLSFFTNLVLTGIGTEGKPVFLKDIWPTRSEIQEVEKKYVLPSMFEEVYSKINVSRLLQISFLGLKKDNLRCKSYIFSKISYLETSLYFVG